MGHALAALAHGWRPWITLYGMGGLASFQPTYHDARSRILISVAGPGAGFFFIAFVMAIVHGTGHSVYVAKATGLPYWIFFDPFTSHNLNELINSLLYINIFWGLMNLLPVYPLDGGQIARELCVNTNSSSGMEQSLWISIFTAAAIAVAGLLIFRQPYLAVMFGYLAYSSYTTLQMYTGRGGGGFGGGFGGGSGGPRQW